MTATNKTVESMCGTMRHDFGLDKPIGEGSASPLASGMTDQERDALRRNMAQIYEHHIRPLEERINEQDCILNSVRDAVGRSNPNRPLQDVVTELAQQYDALRRELLTPQVFSRLAEWLRNPKPASAAFTAGIERQIAYALEMDVLPEVKSLRTRLANAEKRAADACAEIEQIKGFVPNGEDIGRLKGLLTRLGVATEPSTESFGTGWLSHVRTLMTGTDAILNAKHGEHNKGGF